MLVVSKDYAEAVKRIVEHLKGNGRTHIALITIASTGRGAGIRASTRRPLPSQMHHGEARGKAVPAKPLPPLGALGHRERHARGHQG